MDGPLTMSKSEHTHIYWGLISLLHHCGMQALLVPVHRRPKSNFSLSYLTFIYLYGFKLTFLSLSYVSFQVLMIINTFFIIKNKILVVILNQIVNVD